MHLRYLCALNYHWNAVYALVAHYLHETSIVGSILNWRAKYMKYELFSIVNFHVERQNETNSYKFHMHEPIDQ